MLYITEIVKKISNFTWAALLFFALPLFAHAATLGVSPAAGTYSVGDTFKVSVFVSSESQAMNAVSGALNFSKDTLEIGSVSKSKSILSLWVKDPSYTNASGTASFEGVVPNPGFTGKSGTVVTVTFKVKKEGTGSVRITNASVLANDGNGTEIFSSAGSGSYTLIKSKPVPEVPKTSAPTPTTTASGMLQITEIPRQDVTSTTVSFSIKVANTKDVYSNYELRIDQGQSFIWNDSGDGIVTIPGIEPGNHTLLVKTDDHGVVLTGFIDFTVGTISAPVVDYYTKIISRDDFAVIHGVTDPNNSIIAVFKKQGQEVLKETVQASNDGSFTIIVHKLPQGIYTIELVGQGPTGVTSKTVSGMKLQVTGSFYIRINNMVIDGYLASGIIGFVLLVLLFLAFRKREQFPQKSL